MHVSCQFYSKINLDPDDYFRDVLSNIPEELGHVFFTRVYYIPVSEQDEAKIKSDGLFCIETQKVRCLIVNDMITSFKHMEGEDLQETVDYVLSFFGDSATSYDLSERVQISSPK